MKCTPQKAITSAAGARSLLRRLVAARRLPGAGTDARAVDPRPPGRQGRRRRAVVAGAAGDAQRPRSAPARVAARDGVSRPRAAGPRSLSSGGHGLASGRPAAAPGLRPRADRARRARAPARQALLHEHRLRPGSGALLDLRAAGDIRGCARVSGLGGQPATRAGASRGPRGDGGTTGVRTRWGQAGCAVSLQLARSRGDGSLRGAATPYGSGSSIRLRSSAGAEWVRAPTLT